MPAKQGAFAAKHRFNYAALDRRPDIRKIYAEEEARLKAAMARHNSVPNGTELVAPASR